MYGVVKTVASKHTCSKTLPQKTVKFHNVLLRKSEVFAQKFEAVWPFGHLANFRQKVKMTVDRDQEWPL